ncbi:MAG: glycosyltransferase family 2 protein [Pseudolysinimonas sp.]|uniref:glycosyltransferase family 2 protein n=1 Tax=Pseudolysinimonas sp. TaxID=2680009 RepID=UPI003263A21D
MTTDAADPTADAPLTVSVALCTHNGSAYVAEQVRSILAQRPAPMEIVVGDDASSDDTVAVIENTFAVARAADPALDVALRILRRAEPLGVVANFAATLSECRGDLIALSDQDDIWDAAKLARVVPQFAAESSLLLVHTDARLVDAAGTSLGLGLLDALEATPGERAGLESGDAFAVLMRRNLVTGATVVLRRSLVERAAPFPKVWVHDEWLAVIAAALGELRLDPAQLIDYRQHGANQIGARKPTTADRMRKLRETRTERAARLIERSRLLVERLEALGAPAARVAAARGKLAHETTRSRLPRLRLARIPGVLAGALSRRYARYSRGSIDILRDLVQPAGPRQAGGES